MRRLTLPHQVAYPALLMIVALLPSIARAEKTDEPCAELAKSAAEDGKSASALSFAECLEKHGRLGAALRAYDATDKLASKQRRFADRNRARGAVRKLEGRVATVTVTPPPSGQDGAADVRVTVADEELPADQFGKPWSITPGSVVITARAAGYEEWTTTVELAAKARETVTLPKLIAVPVEAPPTEAPAAPAPKVEVTPEPTPSATPGGRLVVEIGAMGGLSFHDIARGSLDELKGARYEYRSSATAFTIAECGNTATIPGAGECEAQFESALGGVVGGQVFVGWALTADLQLGARGFFAARLPTGFHFAGGPSISLHAVGPLWLGATFALGAGQHAATLAAAEGQVPEAARPLNGGAATVAVPTASLGIQDPSVDTGILIGGALEVSIEIVGARQSAVANIEPSGSLFDGSMMVSLWPNASYAPEGFVLLVPVGVSWRFQ